MRIRPAAPADFASIRSVVSAAFGRPDEAGLVEAVRVGGAVLAELVAEDEGAVAGHVLFNRMTCEPALPLAGLAPLSIAPPFQGRGFGAALVRGGLEACRALGAGGCMVLGDPAYYGRFGFTRAPASLASPYSALPAFQALAFDPDVFTRPFAAAYPSAFG